MASNVLTVQATSIINAQGQPVVLRGFNLGGWMNMENFITGYLAEPLLEEYAALFKGMSKSEIDEMMQSFQFNQCVQHTELANILAQSSRESSRS
jgi:hypothetical protein